MQITIFCVLKVSIEYIDIAVVQNYERHALGKIKVGKSGVRKINAFLQPQLTFSTQLSQIIS